MRARELTPLGKAVARLAQLASRIETVAETGIDPYEGEPWTTPQTAKDIRRVLRATRG